MNTRARVAGVTLAAATVLFPWLAAAQDYPPKSIRLIVPLGPTEMPWVR